MHIFELSILAIALSIDTLSVSVCLGISDGQLKLTEVFRIAFVLAIFQAIMPVLGWMGGAKLNHYIAEFSPWLSFSLLFILGLKIIADSIKKEENKTFNPRKLSVLLGLALATSIDAFVVGLSLAFVGANIIFAFIIIGITTFVFALGGIYAGKRINCLMGKKIEIIGGIVLIIISLRVLFLSF